MTVLASKKDPGEVIPVSMDFTKDLLTGETLTGPPRMDPPIQESGAPDASIGSLLVSGTLQLTGNVISQTVANGVAGCSYSFVARSKTSTNRDLAVAATLSIVPAQLQ